jgi:glucose/arabinose dehydrogenase
LLKIAAETITPGWNFPAHSASNSFCFVAKKTHFPADHYADAFIAHHGNAGGTTLRAGYSVDRLLFDKETGKPYGLLPIVKCLDKDNKPLGRPLDCTEAPDGSILFADDAAGVVYRISYTGAKK